MESKKFIIITIAIILLGGMGTFVFASRQDDLDADDINYKKEDSTYKKVDNQVTPPVTEPDPIIDNNSENNEDKIDDITNNNTSTNNKPVKPNTTVQNSASNNKNNSSNNQNNVSNNNSNNQNKEEDPKKDPVWEEPKNPNENPNNPSLDNKPREELTAVVTASNNNGYKKTFRDITITIVANREILPVEGWNLDETRKILTKTFGKNELVDNAGNIVPIINKTLTITGLSDNKKTDVYYSVVNYNPDCPEVEISKTQDRYGNVTTVITQILDKPLTDDGSWVYNEGTHEYVKTETIAGDNVGPIIITLPNGKKETFETTLKIDVAISNYDEDTRLANPTNKPVTVTINSNNVINNVEEWLEDGWSILDEGKTLIKEFTSNMNIKRYIYDLAGNSVYIDEKVENIDMTPVMVTRTKINKGNVEIRFDDFIELPNGWYAKTSTNIISIYKPVQEFSSTNEETITLKDRFGNVSQYKIVLNSDNTVSATLIS